MKSYSLLFIMLLGCCMAVAQDSVVISGKIANQQSDSFAVSYNDNVIAYYPKEYYAPVDKKGNFYLKFPVPQGVYIQLELAHGRKLSELLVKGGDSLYLTANADNMDSTLHYAGKGSEAANFMVRHILAMGRMNQYSLKMRTAINKEPADFLKTIEQDKKAEMAFLAKNKTGLPAPFIRYYEVYYRYYNYFFIQQYPQVHEIVKKRKYTDSVPRENYTVVKDMGYTFNDSFLQVPPYLLYLTGVADIKLKAAGYSYVGTDKERINKIQDSVNVLAYKMMPTGSAEYFMAQNLYGRARTQELERTRSQFKFFKKHWPTSKYTPFIGKQVATAERLAQGQPAPDIAIMTADGKEQHLSDLRGRVVYLTFWAGWCKQCVGEMINGRLVTESIKAKPLEFVYVSINTDTAMDNKVIDKFKFAGTFTNAAGSWKSKEAELYGVQALPAYFLIDAEGKFALQNTPTPSQSTQLILEIEKLLK